MLGIMCVVAICARRALHRRNRGMMADRKARCRSCLMFAIRTFPTRHEHALTHPRRCLGVGPSTPMIRILNLQSSLRKYGRICKGEKPGLCRLRSFGDGKSTWKAIAKLRLCSCLEAVMASGRLSRRKEYCHLSLISVCSYVKTAATPRISMTVLRCLSACHHPGMSACELAHTAQRSHNRFRRHHQWTSEEKRMKKTERPEL
ncbi:hypothetical protein EJ03DRAFT_208693 [Teratosphaeria nubilosa]|uniref:Uncharacterized protein n=1 Tax=Teratosphaeria nubilosa TaxID=161662 RepID=A0A6G1KYC3_9PEZI|nr:hypothetical protein EJ03DRAFT_208693 [Teratosphaeria nubilosa]